MPSPVQSNCDAHDTIANGQYGAVWSMGHTHQICVLIVLLPSNVCQQFFGRSAFLRQQETDLPPAELCEANPQVYVKKPLHPEKLTVWCAFWTGGIIGPYAFKNDEGHNKYTFGDRLISCFGPVNCPPRSCDLTPLDYMMWVYVKSLVYADKPQTLDHLEDNIRRVIADIRPQMLEKVIENWTSRLDDILASLANHMPEIIFKY
ncbi:transposase [Trichonephila clavipes]|nr:transposase [Trichonephila clavipes]